MLTRSEGDDTDPLAVAKRVLVELQRPFEIAGNEVSIGASIGIATGPNSGRRAEDLTDAADRAMYMAKRAGRGSVRGSKADRRGAALGCVRLLL